MPELTLLGKAGAANAIKAGGGDAEVEESEFVEQEGCPEDTDFNRWSHHTGVGTCEDELLQHSLGDSAAVSFVFGLEVNWSLLESREAQYREENELRKEQQRLDLEALNEQRRLKREGLLNPGNSSGSKDKKSKNSNKPQGGDNSDNSDSDDLENQGEDDQQQAEITTEKNSSANKKKRKSDPPDVEGFEADDDGGTPKKSKKSSDAVGEKKNKEKKRKSSDGGDVIDNEDTAMREKNITATSTVKKAKIRTPPMPVDAVITNAKNAAVVTSSSRRTSSTTSAGTGQPLDPLQEIDYTFQADWEYLRRAHSKGKIKTFMDFQLVMKQLKIFNNNWRVIPADYTNINTPTMYTRIPGLKSETCVNHREGFDYFVGDAALMRFMYMQATFLGDGGLVHDALQALDEQERQQQEPEGVSLPLPVAVTLPAVAAEQRTAQRASKKKVICDTDDSEAEDQAVAVEEKGNPAPAFVPMTSSVSKKLFTPAVRVDEIDFGDTDDDKDVVVVPRRDSKPDQPSSEKRAAQTSSKSEIKSPVVKDIRKPARRVIADSEDEENGNEGEGGGESVHEKSASKMERSERGSATKRPKIDHSKADSTSNMSRNSKQVEVLDLTSLTQNSPVVVLETPRRKQKQQHKSDAPAPPANLTSECVHVPAPVSVPSTTASAPPRSTLSILNRAIRPSLVYKGQENLPPNMRAPATASAPSSSVTAAPASSASSDPIVGVTKDKERGSTRDLARSGSLDDSRGLSGSSSSSSDGGSADGEGDSGSSTWTCSFCTLLNNIAEAPKECSVCG